MEILELFAARVCRLISIRLDKNMQTCLQEVLVFPDESNG